MNIIAPLGRTPQIEVFVSHSCTQVSKTIRYIKGCKSSFLERTPAFCKKHKGVR